MKQKFTYQDNCFFDGFKDAQAIGSKRSSLNIPDCSAVTDNQNNCYLTETNEISWLEKFAEDNQKVCNSGLFEDIGTVGLKGSHVNEMKFSFNMNYHTDAKHRQEHILGEKDNKVFELNSGKGYLRMEEEYQSKKVRKEEFYVLGEIQNTENANRAKTRKESIAGSIKKNQKARPAQQEITDYQRQIAECTPLSKLEEMNEKLSKVLRNDQPLTATGKQNTKRDGKSKQSLISCSSPFLASKMAKQKFDDNEKYFKRINEMQKKAKVNERAIFFEEAIDRAEDKLETPWFQDQTTALQALFSRLDISQTGKLTKANCSTDFIPEDFKFIFGNLLTRIKFKQLACNKRQFIKLCEITIRQYNSAQINKILTTLSITSNQEIGKTASSLKKIQTKEQWSQQNYRFDTFEPIDKKRGDSSIESKEGTKLSFIQLQNQVEQKHKNYRSTAASLKKNVASDMPASKKQLLFNDNSQTSLFTTKKPMFQKDIFDSYNQGSSYKKRNASISQLTLEQHKKSLESLNILNKRMQSCLSTNVLNQHSKSPYARQNNLHFDELVKHV